MIRPMTFFIADPHFGHAQVSRERGFASVDEMDALLIEKWNARVGVKDHIYIVGDCFCRNARPARSYLNALHGIKHLVIGNHDRYWLRGFPVRECFAEAGFVLEGCTAGTYFTCCHYPMLDWFRRQHGACLIYGHVHNHTSDPYFPLLRSLPHAYNAGADINAFQPVTLEEVATNTASFFAQHPTP